jgi:hypothetical protein
VPQRRDSNDCELSASYFGARTDVLLPGLRGKSTCYPYGLATVSRAAVQRLAQFNNLGLNFVTFRQDSAQKLSETIRTDPRGILNVNELKRKNVSIRASYYALPIAYLKWLTVFRHRKTPKPSSFFGAEFAVHYGASLLLSNFRHSRHQRDDNRLIRRKPPLQIFLEQVGIPPRHLKRSCDLGAFADGTHTRHG